MSEKKIIMIQSILLFYIYSTYYVPYLWPHIRSTLHGVAILSMIEGKKIFFFYKLNETYSCLFHCRSIDEISIYFRFPRTLAKATIKASCSNAALLLFLLGAVEKNWQQFELASNFHQENSGWWEFCALQSSSAVCGVVGLKVPCISFSLVLVPALQHPTPWNHNTWAENWDFAIKIFGLTEKIIRQQKSAPT